MEQVLITSDGSLLEDIDLSPATVIEDVVQNIATILATTKGTIPYMRGFGRNRETEGRPMPVVKNMIVSDVFQQISDYEPRAILGEIRVEENEESDELNDILITVVLEGVTEIE